MYLCVINLVLFHFRLCSEKLDQLTNKDLYFLVRLRTEVSSAVLGHCLGGPVVWSPPRRAVEWGLGPGRFTPVTLNNCASDDSAGRLPLLGQCSDWSRTIIE